MLYRIGVEYCDFPMGCSPWYSTNWVDQYTLEEAKAECDRRNTEVSAKAERGEVKETAYPVWSFRIIGPGGGGDEIFCDQKTGQPK